MILLVCLEAPAPSRASRTALDLASALASQAQVVTLTAAGPPASPSLALAGACAAVARVLHLDDPALASLDTVTLGAVLAEAGRLLEAGVILAGDRSDDEGQGLVPAAIAHHLGAPLLSRVQSLRLPTPDTIEVTVRAGGQLLTMAAAPPVVLSVPPAASLRELTMGASRAAEVLPLSRLGLDGTRLVPRPELYGALVPDQAEVAGEVSWDTLAATLSKHP